MKVSRAACLFILTCSVAVPANASPIPTSPAECALNLPRTKTDPMNVRTRNTRPDFTPAEHLLVQKQIEQRALQLWRAGGSRADTALSDWLQAEREIVEQF